MLILGKLLKYDLMSILKKAIIIYIFGFIVVCTTCFLSILVNVFAANGELPEI